MKTLQEVLQRIALSPLRLVRERLKNSTEVKQVKLETKQLKDQEIVS